MQGVLPALVVMPGSPQLGPFHLFRGIHAALGRIEWTPGRALKERVLLAMLPCLVALGQETLPAGNLPVGTEWNGSLYAGDSDYDAELTQLVLSVVEELFTACDALSAGAGAGDVLAGSDHAALAGGLFRVVVGGLHLGAAAHPAVGGLRKLLQSLWKQLGSNTCSAASSACRDIAEWLAAAQDSLLEQGRENSDSREINSHSAVQFATVACAAAAEVTA
jgi:hypothetical protein